MRRLLFVVPSLFLAAFVGARAMLDSSEGAPRTPERGAPPGCTIAGTPRDDVLRGTSGSDTICGLGGNDVLLGRAGSDVLIGGSGSDAAFGGRDADDITGGTGIDLLDGGPAADVLRGGPGDDRCPARSADEATSCARPSSDPVVAAAGDIACAPGEEPREDSCRQMATSELVVESDAWAVLTLGDHQYEDGRIDEFQGSYAHSWGRVKAITRPAPGNHDYHAEGYYRYFGPPAGDDGYYSFDVGSWHLIALNSNCAEVGGCDEGSPQLEWLRADLAASDASCTLAYWHHPRFSSGAQHGSNTATSAFWEALSDAGAEVVLTGHDHLYERFAPQRPNGEADPEGIREFVVGTGGRSHYGFADPEPNSEIRHAGTFGVLMLTLHEDGYDWRFVPEEGATFDDAGRDGCH